MELRATTRAWSSSFICATAALVSLSCGGPGDDRGANETAGAGQACSGAGTSTPEAGDGPGTVLVSGGDDALHRFAATGEDLGVLTSQNLRGPAALALDGFGGVFVASSGNDQVVVFSSRGDELGRFSTGGLSIYGLALDGSGNLLVSEGDNAIRRYSPSGRELGVVANLLGRGCPDGIATTSSGALLVADICSSVIRQFSAEGVEGVFATAGLSNPAALAFDDAGNVYVSNTGGPFANTVREFSAAGVDLGAFASTQLEFPAGLAFTGAGELLVANEAQRPGSTDYSIRRFSATGADLGDFAVVPFQPRGVVVTSIRPFARFSPRLEVEPPRRAGWFEADLRVTLDAASDGIRPESEVVRLRVGDLVASIPAGSFRCGEHCTATFDRSESGVHLSIRIAARPRQGGSGDRLDIRIEGRAGDLELGSSPIVVGLAIGDDGASALVQPELRGRATPTSGP